MQLSMSWILHQHLESSSLAPCATGSLEGGGIAFFQAATVCRGACNPRNRVFSGWERDSAQGPWPLCLQIPPQNHKPQSLLTQIYYASSPGWVVRFYVGASSQFWYSGWWARDGDDTPCTSGGNVAGEISLQNLSSCQWKWGQPFLHFCPSCQSWCSIFCKYCYKTSVQLVFIWLSRLIILYFSCNSSLVLRGGDCNLYLLCHHLVSRFVGLVFFFFLNDFEDFIPIPSGLQSFRWEMIW